VSLAKLAANLSAAEGQDMTEADAGGFLARNSFVLLGGDVRTCEEAGLRLLHRSEILEIERPQ
jgi:hypothetical protein